MRYFKDMVGIVVGRLTVIKRSGNTKSGAIKWSCRCECGRITVVDGTSLRKRGKVSSL